MQIWYMKLKWVVSILQKVYQSFKKVYQSFKERCQSFKSSFQDTILIIIRLKLQFVFSVSGGCTSGMFFKSAPEC